MDFSQKLRNSFGLGGLLTGIGGFQELSFPQKSLFIQQEQAPAQSPAPPRDWGGSKKVLLASCPFRALSRARIRAGVGLWGLETLCW